MKFKSLLQRTSEKSDCPNYRIAAVLVKGSSIVNFGFNHRGTSRLIERKRHLRTINDSVHAEVHAILGVSKSVTSRCDIYVARFTLDGEPANAKPCVLCQAILKEMGVKRAFYTEKGSSEYKVMSLR